ncbi:hypothetical protein M9Y10_002547 [Tritrichomonas musculus]|uniref:Uncharacterized protein n=1 Tax=Tritrichomonas musculus TaxID=1915356 RepID=A0ABR2LA64_9EUKA
MYPRQPISYSPYPQQTQGYPTVYYAQPLYPYHNYPNKMAQMSYTPEPTALMTPPSNPPPLPTQLPPQHENVYINYHQPQQPILHQPPLTQQPIPQQHIHPQQIQQQQQQRQYEISHQINQIQQVPVSKPRPLAEQYIPQQIKIKNKPLYPSQLSPQIPIQKQIIQQAPQRAPIQQIMISQPPPPIQQPPRQYSQIPQKQPQVISQPQTKQIEQSFKIKQEDSNILSSSHKLSFLIQENEPPGCFDIIGRGNLPSIFFNSEISFI